MVAATVWGLIWYPYRLLQEAGVSGSLSSLLTYVAGLPLLIFLARHALRLRPEQRPWLLAVALSAGWTNLAYVLAVIDGEVMRVLLLFYLAPLWTVFFARLLLHERIGKVGLAVLAMSLTGAIVMLHRGDGLPLPASTAEWLGLSAGMGFALSNVLTRKVSDIPIELRSLSVFLGVAVISLVPVFAEAGAMQVTLSLDSGFWLMIVGIAATLILATYSVQFGLAHTPANQAIVILLSELVVAAISSRLLAGEIMQLQEWIGGSLIVAATLFSGRMEHG